MTFETNKTGSASSLIREKSKSLRKKLESIRSSKSFGIIADEYTDISNKESWSMCFRWIKDLRVHEDFVGYYELPGIKSDTIV